MPTISSILIGSIVCSVPLLSAYAQDTPPATGSAPAAEANAPPAPAPAAGTSAAPAPAPSNPNANEAASEQAGLQALMAMQDYLRVDSVEVGSFGGRKSIFESSAAVSVITEESWRTWGARQQAEAIRFVPGVLPMLATQNWGPVFRGFADVNSLFNAAGTIDGVNIGSFLFGLLDFNLEVMDRIEIMRGPGSTLYGSDALNGTLALHTWNPKENRLEFHVGGGSMGYYTLSARAKHYWTDKLYTTLVFGANGLGDSNSRLDYMAANPLNPFGPGTPAHEFIKDGYKMESLVAKVGYGELVEAAFYFNMSERYGYPAPIQFGLTGGSLAYHNAPTLMGIIKGVQQIGDSSWKLSENIYFGDTGGPNGRSVNTTPSGAREAEEDAQYNAWGGEIRLTQEMKDLMVPFEWHLAYQLRDIVDVTDHITDAGLKFPTSDAVGTSSINHGVVLDGTVHFADNLIYLNPGLRFDYFSLENPHPAWQATYNNINLSYSNLSGHATVGILPTNDTAIKLVYARGFHAPVPLDVFGLPPVIGSNLKLRPETLDTYELVLMAKKETWTAELVGYYNRFTNQLQDGVVPGSGGLQVQTQNLGLLDGYGVEFSGGWTINPLSLQAAITYNRSRQLEPKLANADLHSFPSWIIDAGTEVEIAPAYLTLGLQVRALLDRNQNPSTTAPIPLHDYFRLDLHALWRVSRLWGNNDLLDILVNVDNVTNSPNSYTTLYDMAGYHEAGIYAQGSVRVRY